MLKTQTQLSPSLVQPAQESYFWVRLIGLFLLFQGGGLLVVSLYLIRWLNGEIPDKQGVFMLREIEALWGSRLFVPLAILTFFAAINFLLLRPMGWLLAMLIQSLTLLSTLILYFQWQSELVYPIMLYCIIMVLYLNSSYVRHCFDNKSRANTEGHS